MDLEKRLERIEPKKSMIPVWERRHALWQWPFRIGLALAYALQGYGPKAIKGPALVVFDSHPFSSDPILMARQNGYFTMVAREGKAFLSRIAPFFGGIVVGEGKDGLKRLEDELYLHFNHGHVVGLFPVSDVGEEEIKLGAIKAAIRWEQDMGRNLPYVAATVKYERRFNHSGQINLVRKSQWPWPFLTKARIFISVNYVYSDKHSQYSVAAKQLLSKLAAESSQLPRDYLRV